VSGSTGQACEPTALTVTVIPSTGTADHAAAAPGNQVQFAAQVGRTIPKGCPLPPYAATWPAVWVSSDPTDVQVNNSQSRSLNGLTTCVAATKGAATLTATYTEDKLSASGTGTITCK